MQKLIYGIYGLILLIIILLLLKISGIIVSSEDIIIWAAVSILFIMLLGSIYLFIVSAIKNIKKTLDSKTYDHVFSESNVDQELVDFEKVKEKVRNYVKDHSVDELRSYYFGTLTNIVAILLLIGGIVVLNQFSSDENFILVGWLLIISPIVMRLIGSDGETKKAFNELVKSKEIGKEWFQEENRSYFMNKYTYYTYRFLYSTIVILKYLILIILIGSLLYFIINSIINISFQSAVIILLVIIAAGVYHNNKN